MLLKYISENKEFDYEGFKEYWINEMKDYNGYKDKATKCSLEYFFFTGGGRRLFLA